MIFGGFHTAFPMGDASRVGEARRHAAQLADECLLDELEAGRLALGTWQGIYLWEHRKQGHRRELMLHVLGER